jgi:hypothetical protein
MLVQTEQPEMHGKRSAETSTAVLCLARQERCSIRANCRFPRNSRSNGFMTGQEQYCVACGGITAGQGNDASHFVLAARSVLLQSLRPQLSSSGQPPFYSYLNDTIRNSDDQQCENAETATNQDGSVIYLAP